MEAAIRAADGAIAAHRDRHTVHRRRGPPLPLHHRPPPPAVRSKMSINITAQTKSETKTVHSAKSSLRTSKTSESTKTINRTRKRASQATFRSSRNTLEAKAVAAQLLGEPARLQATYRNRWISCRWRPKYQREANQALSRSRLRCRLCNS